MLISEKSLWVFENPLWILYNTIMEFRKNFESQFTKSKIFCISNNNSKNKKLVPSANYFKAGSFRKQAAAAPSINNEELRRCL